HSSFDEAELEREKLVVVEEIKRGRDNPGRVFSQELFKAAFRVHPYGRTVIGTPESVSSVTRRDMLKFFRQWYTPGNMKLVVVGGVEAEDVFRVSREYFSSSATRGGDREEVREPLQEETRIFRLNMDTDPARISLAFPINALTDPDTPVLDLLAAVLSQGNSSRLNLNLRDRGIVHSAWAYAYTPKDPGLFILGAAVGQDKVAEGLEGLLDQVAQLQRVPVPREEIDRARDQILNERIFDLERVEGQAREVGFLALTLGDLDFNDIYYSRLQSVDSRDLMAAAKRVFSPTRTTAGFLTRDPGSQPTDEEIGALLTARLSAEAADVAPTRGASIFRGTLPNGITLLVREDPRLPLVAVRAGVLGGVRYEEEATQGAFNLLAHLLARGTENYSAAELALRLDEMSATLGGFSGRNSFGVTGKFLSHDTEEGLGLVRELFTRATIPEDELDLHRERVISAIRAQKDNMTSYALDLFRRTLFQDHPYRFSTMGTEESVTAITREDLLRVYREIVKPDGMVIAFAGDIKVDEAYRLVERTFGDLEGARYDRGPIPMEMSRQGVNMQKVQRDDKEQSHVILGYQGPTLDSDDRDPLDVLNAVMAGQGGRLFAELRDRQSLAYSVFSFVAPGLDPGYIAFGIGVSPGNVDRAVNGFLDQIRLIRDEPVSGEELDRARKYLIGSHMIGLQDLGSRADEVFFPVLYGQDLEDAMRYSERIRAVTASQVQEMARKYLDPENYTLAVVAGEGSGGTE
ncbi:MAG: insulinase family protein, partial [bacterium]